MNLIFSSLKSTFLFILFLFLQTTKAKIDVFHVLLVLKV
eukprot:UN16061